MQACVVAVGSDRRILAFGRLNDKVAESYEVEKGMSKMNGAKAPGLEHCQGKFLRK